VAIEPVDLVLSSGFLAFAEQAGFLAAVEDEGLPVAALCGTSSGALAGSLWLAGLSAAEVFEELCRRPPLGWVRPSRRPWRGLFGLQRVMAELERHLPASFEGLGRPLGAGVARGDEPVLLTSGSLPDAVAASCAVPYLFQPVRRGGEVLRDGGVVDRTALTAWRRHRPGRPVVMHLLDSSRGAEHPVVPDGVCLVRSPASGASLWSLGDAEARFAHTRRRAGQALSRWVAGVAARR